MHCTYVIYELNKTHDRLVECQNFYGVCRRVIILTYFTYYITEHTTENIIKFLLYFTFYIKTALSSKNVILNQSNVT